MKLRRIRSGSLSIDDAISFEDLAVREKATRSMTSLADSISTMSSVVVTEDAVIKIRSGMKLLAGWIESCELNKGDADDLARVMTSGGALVSIARMQTNGVKYADLSADFEVGKSIRVFN